MRMIQTEKLVYEYEKRDEEGNIIGSHRAINAVDVHVEPGEFVAILVIMVQENLHWQNI